MGSCEGRVAIVTGGGNGMGRAAAHLLAKEGAKVVVNDVAASKVEPGKMCADIVAEEIRAMGYDAVSSNDDLADPATGEKLVKLAVDTYGTVDILCMVAGATTGPMLIEDMSVELFQKIVNINTTSMFALMHHAVPIMKEKGYGRIVAFASRAAFGGAHSAAYSASKGGVMGLVAEQGFELSKYGIKVNCILPSAVTGMFPKSKVAYDGTPRPAPEGPEPTAPMTVYLCSEACDPTGEYFYVSGCDVGLYPRNRLPVGLIRKGNEVIWTVDELVKMVPETFGWYFATRPGDSVR